MRDGDGDRDGGLFVPVGAGPLAGEEFLSFRGIASGGHLSFCATKRKMEKKKRQRKPIPSRFPLESFPDGERGSAPFDPLAGDEGRGTGGLHRTTEPGNIRGGIQWGAIGPPWPGGGVVHAPTASRRVPSRGMSRGTIRKVPRAILWFLSHRGERNAPPARRTLITDASMLFSKMQIASEKEIGQPKAT